MKKIFLILPLIFSSICYGEPNYRDGTVVEFGDCENGYGKIVWKVENSSNWKAGTYYEGYFKNGLPNGYGKIYYSATGSIYFGEVKNGLEHGFGMHRWPNGIGHTGEYKDGKPNGIGFSISYNGDYKIYRTEEDAPGLTLKKNKKLERHDINSISPTKDPDSLTGIYIPLNLEDAFKELNKMFMPELVEKMRKGPETEMIRYFFGFGRWMRNNWGLRRGLRLSQFFNKQGVSNPDDISLIILKSYWRHLNKKPINLSKQIKSYQSNAKK